MKEKLYDIFIYMGLFLFVSLILTSVGILSAMVIL